MAEALQTYEDLKKLLQNSERDYDMELIDRAYHLADDSHSGQKRLSGDSYISHPVAVACILVELGMDSESIAAGLLHDVVEDTPITLEQISKGFGEDIAKLINGVTKLGRIPYSSREEQQAENLRKMLIAMAEDIRVIIIKLADRLHNMRTVELMAPQNTAATKHLENMEVYAPIAHRLGIRAWSRRSWRICRCAISTPSATRKLKTAWPCAAGSGRRSLKRPKKTHLRSASQPESPMCIWKAVSRASYGIYRKMFIQGKSMDEIYDIYAVRVIVDTVNDCYNVLGVIHDMLPARSPNRFKDYISTPKPNVIPVAAHNGYRQGRASPSRCRSAPGRCTIRPNTVSPRTGNTSLA